MFDGLMGMLAPHQCLGCGAEGSFVCSWCRPNIAPRLPERCYGCRTVMGDSQVCAGCRKRSGLSHVWVCTAYTSAAQQLIYRLKFARARQAARVVAQLLDDCLPYLEPDVLVTFVPTATSRVRLRGYDQSALIARHVARRRGLVCQRLLLHRGQSRQVGASRSHRRRQADQSYMLAGRVVQGKTVLIIDDVVTTGVTIEAAARMVRQAGAARVMAAAFAQK